MAHAQSPKIVTDGLVFCADMSNKKSWRGRPTTNFYANGQFKNGNHVTQANGGAYSNPVNDIIPFPNPGDSEYCLRSTAVGGNQYTEYEMIATGLQANTTYCMSCWYAWTPDWDGTTNIFHSRWWTSAVVEAGTTNGSGTTIETRNVGGITWYRGYQTFTTAATTDGNHSWYAGYPSQNTKGFRLFTNFQLEQGSYPSNFIDGSRSSTTSLVDLSASNVLDASNLVYENDGSFSLNGTSNYISAATVTLPSGASDSTMIVWCRPDSTGQPSSTYTGLMSYGNRSSSDSRLLSLNTGGSTYYVSSAYWANDYVPNNLVVNKDAWNMVAMTTRGGGVNNNTTLYCGNSSGLSSSTGNSTSYTTVLTTQSKNLAIGCTDFPGRFMKGKIAFAAIYNRSLSSYEMLENFNALRGRFGV